MRSVRSLVAVLASVALVVPAVVLADGRMALADMSAMLPRLGFEVATELATDRLELTEALRAFTRQSAGATASLVFYAGRGIEINGVNYHVPVDACLECDVDVRFETVAVDDLLVSMSGASLRLVILDACPPHGAGRAGVPSMSRQVGWPPLTSNATVNVARRRAAQAGDRHVEERPAWPDTGVFPCLASRRNALELGCRLVLHSCGQPARASGLSCA